MNNNISSELDRIISLAKIEAARLGMTEVKAEHLLLGLAREKECQGSKILLQLKVTQERLEQKAEEILHIAKVEADASGNVVQELMLDANCERILRLAQLEARLLHAPMADGRHLLLAMLRYDIGGNARILLSSCNVSYNQVAHLMGEESSIKENSPIVSNSVTDSNDNREFVAAGSMETIEENQEGSKETPFINQYGRDLTAAAKAGAMDPLVGRSVELRRVAQILQRRKKNNPILVGEPGAGKSAIVEGLAQLIATHKAGPSLEGKRIVALDMAQIVAGTQYRGQFEERLRRLIDELTKHKDIILFIDEIHTIVGAGSAAGTLDAANILKPALARGEIRCIGATSTAEYRKTIEKDAALERRFQQVRVEPTTQEETLAILHNIKDRYEHHHKVQYTEEALTACVVLTERYISGRCLPDKAIDALDEAGAQAYITYVEEPVDISSKRCEAEELQKQIKAAAQQEDYKTAAMLRETLKAKEVEISQLSAKWQDDTCKEKCTLITDDDVARVVSSMSHIPVQRLQQDERHTLRSLQQKLSEKVIAQDEAIKQLARAIQRSRLGLKDPNRPIATFMFVGPTGVGKTHLAKSLAEEMFGTSDALIRIDMSEYGEKHTGARLVGAPPGYVGFEEGGQLTERVRRRPYSIILLDEIEKAHQDVFNMLLQVMDEGRMTDGNGVTVDFRNTIIIMTSNSGSRQIQDFGAGVGFGAENLVSDEQIQSITQKSLQKQFAPEFLNRLDDIIIFRSLSQDDTVQIVRLEMRALLKRLADGGYTILVNDEVYEYLAQVGYESKYGARSIKRTIQDKVENLLCNTLMEVDFTSKTLSIVVKDDKLAITY